MKESELELKQDEFYYDIDFDAKRNLLDSIVNEEIDRWKLFNIGFNKPEDNYISEDDQTALVKELSAKILKTRMTPAVMSSLSYYYRINTTDELSSIVCDTVNLAVIQLVMETNNMDIPDRADLSSAL